MNLKACSLFLLTVATTLGSVPAGLAQSDSLYAWSFNSTKPILPTLDAPSLNVPTLIASSKADANGTSAKGGTKSDAEENPTPYPPGSENAKLYAFGARQMAAGEFKKARDTFRTLAYKQPNDPMPSLKVSLAAYKAGDVDDALDWAKKACVISPKFLEAHLQLARLFEANQDYKAACLQYEVIYETEPNKQGKLNIEYPMLRALIHAQDYEKADKLSTEWTHTYKRSADAFFNRAWTLSMIPDRGDPTVLEDAVKNYRLALKLDPKRHDARFNMALLLMKMKQDEMASTELEKFMQEAPGDPDAERAKTMLSKLRSANSAK